MGDTYLAPHIGDPSTDVQRLRNDLQLRTPLKGIIYESGRNELARRVLTPEPARDRGSTCFD
jgi:hypothetical protein